MEVSYTIYWNEGYDEQAANIEVTTTPNRCHPVEVPLSSGNVKRSLYKFRVRAANACGTVEANGNQNMARCPDVPTCVLSLQASCSLLIKWAAPPYDGGSPITRFEIEIETASYGRYARVQCNGRGAQNACEVSMDTLRAHPFNLRTSDDVNVRMKACN